MQTELIPSAVAADVVAGNLVDGLFQHALERRMTPSLRNRLATAGLDVETRAAGDVQRSDFATWLRLTVESLFAGSLEADAYRQLGHDLVRGYSMTLKGSAIVAVARMMGPRRTLERMAKSADSIASRYTARLEEQSEGCFHFFVNEPDLAPTFLAGVLAEAATLAGARDVQCEPLRREDGGWRYELRWSAK
ncbi:MAG: DUF2378 family protein [Myxococcaceae bacterium]